MKLDRRAAIGLLMMTVLPNYTNSVNAGQSKLKVNIPMDAYESFTVSYKGRSQTFSTEDVMNALFGEGTFGH